MHLRSRMAPLALASLMMLEAAAGARPAKWTKRKAAPRSAPAAATTELANVPAPAPATEAKAAETAEPTADVRRSLMAANEAPAPATEAKEPTPAAPTPVSPGPPAPSASAVDLEKLRADYDRLRDDLFRARSRAQIVEEALWTSKLSASFRWKGAPDYVVHHATVRLDGGEIWDSGEKAVTDDLVTVAERAVKPGPHAVTVRLEIRPGKKSKDSDRLGYTSEHTFAIIIPEGKRTRMEITGDEDGDAPEYEAEIEVELESKK
jgi:hypothetical protein